MTELFRAVVARPGITLGVATAFPGLRDLRFEQDGATFYATGQKRRAATFAGTRTELEKCAAMVRDFQPDLVHFHGSERFFGLLKAEGLVRVPAVVSLQGLLGPCSSFRNFFGGMSPLEILRSIRLAELPLRLGLAWQYGRMRQGARHEASILAAADGLLGRTDWDEAYGRQLNPRAPYCRVDEILRGSFRDTQWSLDACEPHTLIYTNAGHPMRGTPNLLAAAAIVRREFPAVRLRLAGLVSERSGYGRFLRRRIRDLGLADCVEFPGYLDGDALARTLARSHAFVISSYVENSPNSLAEAMTVGMPCVASFVGGIPSMVDHGRTGLLYPVDDVRMLAGHILRVFRDADMAVRVGAAAREAATARHDPDRVVAQLMAAYGKVIGSVGAGGH
jgi:glycosyltransferase involved in cell wall biosynthesis